MAKPRKTAAIIIAVSIAAFTGLYRFFPVTAHENIPAFSRDVTVIQYTNDSNAPFFANLTIPGTASSVHIDMSLNITYYGVGTSVQPSSVIVGIFSGNNTTYGLERAGFYQPSNGYYEIIIDPMSYSYEIPLFDHKNVSKIIGYDYVNYTFKGKSYNVGIDTTLDGPVLEVHVNWIQMFYTYTRY